MLLYRSTLTKANGSASSSLLLLYEPFILGSDEDDGFRRSLAAASSILRITEAIYSHSQDQIAYYNPQINFCWMVANRTLVRAMRFREDAGDGVGAEVYRGQVEFLLVSLALRTFAIDWAANSVISQGPYHSIVLSISACVILSTDARGPHQGRNPVA